MCAPDSRGKSRRGLLLVTAVVVLLGSFIAVLAPAASAASPAASSGLPSRRRLQLEVASGRGRCDGA